MARSYWAQSNANPARRRAILEAHVPEDRAGCWTWPGTKLLNGYGVMRGGSHVRVYVHRVSYELHVGPIPAGMELDHLCRNRACFNPAHLEPVTTRTNFRRGAHPNAVAHRTNICRKGLHPLTGANVVTGSNGRRRCRACNAEWQRARYAERMASRAQL